MGERLAGQVESRLGRLEASVADLEYRLRLLEAGAAAAPGRELTTHAGAATAGARLESDPVAVVSLLGRLLLVAAGAYFLRALTDSAVMPAAIGVVAGLSYAGGWALAANRAAASGQRLSATFHAAAAIAIAYPLLWEAHVRFALVSPATATGGLAVVTAALLGLAWRRSLHVVAWLVTLAGLAASASLMVATGAVVAFAGYLIALGIGTLWLGYVRGWIGLRWPVAIAADIAVVGATSRSLRPVPLDPVAAVLALQLLLPTAYLSTIAARTLWLGRRVVPFEIVQATAALAAGLGGAIALTSATGVGHQSLGVVALVMGGAGYAVAFAFVDRRQRGGANFYFYTSLALALVVTGAWVLLAGDLRAVSVAALGVCAAWAGRWYERATLTTHAAAFLVVAAGFDGLLVTSTRALLGLGGVPSPPTATGWSVALAAAVSLALAYRPATDAPAVRAPHVALAALLATWTGGLLVATGALWLSSIAEAPLAPATLVTIRSGVLAVSALGLAALGLSRAHVEFRWLVYPVLAVGGLKLLLEDFRLSPPAMLVVALAFYGTALIVAPRLCRRATREGQRASAAPSAAVAAEDREVV